MAFSDVLQALIHHRRDLSEAESEDAIPLCSNLLFWAVSIIDMGRINGSVEQAERSNA